MNPADRYLERLAEAVRIPTVAQPEGTDPDALDRLTAWITTTYPRVWETLESVRLGHHSHLLTWMGTDAGADPVLLLAHQDVVPVEDASAWTHPPFSAERDGTHLHGRGTLDDKAAMVGLLEVADRLVDEGFVPRRSLMVGLGHDEEIGGHHGASTIARYLRDRGTRLHLVVDEGGFVTEGVVPGARRPVALVGIAEKGSADIEISAEGQPGHSSAPPHRTAIGKVAAAIAALDQHPMPARTAVLQPSLQAVPTAYPPVIGPLAGRLLSVPRLGDLLLSRRPTTNALIRTTIAATVVEGGVASNVLPSRARAIVNARILPGDTVSSVIDHVRSIVGDEVVVSLLPGASDPGPPSDPSSPHYAAVAAAVGRTFPEATVVPWVLTGMTDSRHFADLADEILRFTPLRVNAEEVSGFHGVDERIRLDDAPRVLDFYEGVIRSLASG